MASTPQRVQRKVQPLLQSGSVVIQASKTTFSTLATAHSSALSINHQVGGLTDQEINELYEANPNGSALNDVLTGLASQFRPGQKRIGSLARPRTRKRRGSAIEDEPKVENGGIHAGHDAADDENFQEEREAHDKWAKSIEPEFVDPYLISLAYSTFRTSVFLFELVLHIFQPIMMILSLVNSDCYRLSVNRAFIYAKGRAWQPVIVQNVLLAACIVVNVLWFLDRAPSLSIYGLAYLNSNALLRLFVVCSKYGYFTPLEYKEYILKFVPIETIIRVQILTGWNLPSRAVRESQLVISAVRQRCSLQNLQFHVKDLAANAEDVKKEQSTVVAIMDDAQDGRLSDDPTKYIKREKGSIDVTVSPIVAKKFHLPPIVKIDEKEKHTHESEENKDETPQPSTRSHTACSVGIGLIDESLDLYVNLYWSFSLAAITSLIPIIAAILNWVRGRLDTAHWSPEVMTTQIFIHILATTSNFSLNSLFFSFLFVGVTDFRRREYFHRRLSNMLNDGLVRVPVSEDDATQEMRSYEIVRFSIDNVQNIVSWWYVRLCLHDWGSHFRRRVHHYIGIFLTVVIVNCVVLFVEVLVVAGDTDLTMLLYTILYCLFFTILIVVIVFWADAINRHRDDAVRQLLKAKMQLAAENAFISNCKVEDWCHTQAVHNARRASIIDAMNCINGVIAAVEVDNTTNFVKFLGLQASFSLLQGLLFIVGLASLLAVYRIISVW